MEILILAAVSVALSVAATISLSGRRPFGLPDVVWLAIVWLVAFIGPILWFAVGRSSGPTAR